MNPWGLSELQLTAIKTLHATGANKAAARALGVDIKKFENAMYVARRKMGTSSRIHAVLIYERWLRAL